MLVIALLTVNGVFAQATNTIVKLEAKAFAEKIKALPNAPLIDVRTPEEFGEGHLAKALNYDWYGAAFDKQIATLDKSKPVFLYCRSGGRSASAVAKMKAAGFNEIYELSGGIMSWTAAGLPQTK